LDIPQVHIGGASMGGMVSLQFALDHPDMVRSLILVDSYPHTPRAIREALEHWIADTEERGYARVMETFNDDYGTALFSPGFWEREPHFPAFETELVLKNLMPDPAFIGCCRAIQAFDVSARLPEIKAPALIVTPNEGIAYEEGLRMHQQLARSELWAPEDVGHSVHLERPEQFNRRVLQFLSMVEA
jgi:pimeloyl-ACP methyl ester carboxylesterase